MAKRSSGPSKSWAATLFEELFAKVQVAALINEGIDEIEKGANGMYGDEFFDRMTKKYGK